MRGDHAQRHISHVVQNFVIGHTAFANELDACFVQTALGKLFEQSRARARGHKYKQGIGLEVTHPLQKRCVVGVAQGHPNFRQNLSAIE